MEPNHHPDEERLAAYAGGEPDVQLREHLGDCARCRSVVDELAMLRAALAELPDLAPSRRLQLLPPVPRPEPSAAERLAGWTRRAFMPLLAAGFGLAIVGSVGTVGSTFSMGSAGAAPASVPVSRDVAGPSAAGGAAPSASTTSDSKAPGLAAGESASASPEPARAAAAASGSPAERPPVQALEQPPTETPRSLWPMVLFAGVALIVATLLLRWIVQPRAA